MDDIVEVVSPARPRRTLYAAGLVGTGLVAGVIVAGLNVASAQTSPSPSPSASSTAPDGKLGRHGGPFGHRGMRGIDGALHGEFTTNAPGGGYQVMAMQVGDATAVTATSITVKSADGYSRTYAVTDDTLVNAGNAGITDVKTGDQVRVLAVVKDGTASAVHVMDVTNVRDLRGKWLPHRVRPSAGTSSSAT